MKRVLGILTLIIGLAPVGQCASGFLFYESSTTLEGTLYGDGTGLTGVTYSEADPVFVAAQSTIAVLNANNTFSGLQVIASSVTANVFNLGSVTVSSVSAAAADTSLTATCTGTTKVLFGGCQTAPATTVTQFYSPNDTTWKCETTVGTAITATITCINKD